MNTQPAPAGDIGSHFPARYWQRLDDGRFQCDLCPRLCKLHDGQRGACFVRMRAGDRSQVVGYTSIAFCEAETPSHARH